MSKVAVVYWSGTGNTEAMAHAVAEGCGGTVIPADDFNGSKMDAYDAVAFGCPAMGAEELEDGEFIPMFESCKPKLAGKKIALFGSFDWGDGEWMRIWEEDCRKLGANLAAEGLILHMTPDDDGLNQCRALGEKLK